MKKTLLIMAVSLSLNQMAIAQGFLGKLRDKVAQTGSEGARSNNKLSDTNIKQAEEDKNSDFLEKKTGGKADPNKLAGLYYSKTVIVGLSDSKKKFGLKKFLLSFEDDDNGLFYTLKNQYSFDGADAKILPIKLSSELFALKVNKKAGIIALQPDYDSVRENYFYIGNKYQVEIEDGSAVCPKSVKPETLKIATFYFIEDGIIAICPDKYQGRDYEKGDCFKEFQQYFEPVILYKKEKEQRAMQITSEEIHKKLAIYGKKYIETLDKGTVGSDLPEPGAAGNSPLFAEPKSKVIEAFKKHMINQGLSQYVPIYAYGHNNYAEYSELTIPHPMSGIRVKNGRAVDYIVVAKNLNKNNKGKNTNLFVEAEHVFFHVNLHNFVKNGQYNTDDYQPTWIVGNITAPSVGVIDEGENVLKYKGK